MDDKENLRIKVEILGRSYTIKIKRTDTNSEEVLRKAAHDVDEVAKSFQSLGLKDKDGQDYLALAAIKFAVNAIDAENQVDLSALLKELKDINFQLSTSLETE